MRMTDKEYQEHPVFSGFDQFIDFYDSLAALVLKFCTVGTQSMINIDSYVYSSIQGTLHSIKIILGAGRQNDAYALLRKYYDSAIINVYTNLYLQDNISIENFIVEKINHWLKGIDQLPEYRVMSQYIKASGKLATINNLLQIDDRYKKIRDRCNAHTHYNFFTHIMLNDNAVYLKNRGKWLDLFLKDTKDIFILHLAYLFFLNDYYMASSDYWDSLDCDVVPEENCQYWVAPFIQEIFDAVISVARSDIATAIKENTSMQLT